GPDVVCEICVIDGLALALGAFEAAFPERSRLIGGARRRVRGDLIDERAGRTNLGGFGFLHTILHAPVEQAHRSTPSLSCESRASSGRYTHATRPPRICHPHCKQEER